MEAAWSTPGHTKPCYAALINATLLRYTESHCITLLHSNTRHSYTVAARYPPTQMWKNQRSAATQGLYFHMKVSKDWNTQPFYKDYKKLKTENLNPVVTKLTMVHGRSHFPGFKGWPILWSWPIPWLVPNWPIPASITIKPYHRKHFRLPCLSAPIQSWKQ